MTSRLLNICSRIVLLSAFLIPPPESAVSQDVSVRTDFNSSSLIVNQEATLSVEITGKNANRVSNAEMPEFNDWFAFAGSKGRSQNISIVNGRVSASVILSYSLIPLKTGLAKLAPVTVKIGNDVYRSDEISIEIVDAGNAPAMQGRQQDYGGQPNQPLDLFVRAIPDKPAIYQNEGVTVEYKIYIGPGVTVREYSLENMPNTVGFWTEDYPLQQPVPRGEVYNNKRYQSAILKRLELFPTNSGEFELDPMQFEFTVRDPQQRRSRFDSFFDNAFSSNKRVRINSGKLNISVKPLPTESKPGDFSGLVGTFDISSETDNRTVKANESVTLKVKISGTGNIRMIDEPEISITGVHEKYDPQINESINRIESTISGEKTFEYVVIPRREGELRIDPVVFSYFDPGEDRYKTKRTSPINIRVEPGDLSITRTPRNLTREEVRLVGSDIRFIKESVREWYSVNRGMFSLLFISFLIFPLVLIGGTFVYSRHINRLSADIGYKRSRRASAAAGKHLKEAKKALDNKDEAKYYPEIAKALQDYIADKLNISAAGILTEELEKILINKNIDSQILKQYIACLQQCDFHRFSSVSSDEDEMKRLYNASEEAISNMDDHLKKK